jgi:hypothetical protein
MSILGKRTERGQIQFEMRKVLREHNSLFNGEALSLGKPETEGGGNQAIGSEREDAVRTCSTFMTTFYN